MKPDKPDIKIGDTVEDTRAKSMFDPDPNDCYSGIFGEVTEVTDSGFRVRWADYEVSYDFAFLKMGIRRVEKRK